jgi:hypothetical protein
VQRRRVLRLDFQDFPIEVFCLIQSAGIVMLDGITQSFLQPTLHIS